MNIKFEVREDHTKSGPAAIARMRAVNAELRDEIMAIVKDAVQAGQQVAEMEAPRGSDRPRDGVPIRDAIRTSETRYHPGGLGGGGFYEADLHADGLLAPHLRFVYEGTADEGRGLIHASRGNVMALQKEGEQVRFREWVHGQRPQTLWWERAREEAERILESGVRGIK